MRALHRNYWIAFLLALLLAVPATAQNFPPLTGRVVDAANILSPATKASITQTLEALETQSQRQLVVATVPSLDGYDVADYGYQLGRTWGIGDKTRNDGVVLLIAPNERRMHIAVGYGLEPVLTDALASQIIRNDITPKFKDGDFDGGVTAGVNAIVHQLQLPPDQARAVAQQAVKDEESGGKVGAIIFWAFVAMFIFAIILNAKLSKGQRYRSRSGGGPVVVWGGGSGWGSGGGGGWSSGGGGFSGGGGSFGGGGASGGW